MSGDSVAIIGASAMRVGKYMTGPGATGSSTEADRLVPVVRDAIERAGISIAEIDTAVFTSNPPSTRQNGFPAFMAARLGLKCRTQISEVGAMGATGAIAFDSAAADIILGRSEYALALGVCYQANEKPYHAANRGVTVVGDVDFQAPFGATPISWYALDAARYFYESGIGREDVATVAIKSREFSRHNPVAQYHESLTMQEIVTAPEIVDPLGRWEVPSQADGAICLVLTSSSNARARPEPHAEVVSRGFGHDGYHQIGYKPHDMLDVPAARDSVNRALESANLTLGDIDCFELYAPCTITEVVVSESIGLFDRGKGALATATGVTGPGGRTPINTSGGCLARGHPPSLTGLYSLLECYEQVTGRGGNRQVMNAHHALCLAEGGHYNLAVAHVIAGHST